MSNIGSTLPEGLVIDTVSAFQSDAIPDVLKDWTCLNTKALDGEDNTIDMFDIIGEDFWGDGVTVKSTARALAKMAGKDIQVRVNSPGGDVFEGLGIYNLLRMHDGNVRVNVLGYAASAASVIAMAGDEIIMGQGSLMMIHRAWGLTMGNQDDMREVAEFLAKIDGSMGEIYAARTGLTLKAIDKLLAKETWLSAREAVDQGFAHSVDVDSGVNASAKTERRSKILMRRKVEASLSRDGIPRSARPEMIAAMLKDEAPRDASLTAERDAGEPSDQDIQSLIDLMKT